MPIPDIRPGEIYKLPDNSVRIKVIFDSCSAGWAAVALVTKSTTPAYRKGQYLSGLNMQNFVRINKKGN